MSDPQTLAVYAREAERYRARFADKGADGHLQAFLDALPAGADVLDLGCGPGRAAALMQADGHRVVAMDATPEFVAQARALGVDARLARFDDLDAAAAFDGIWANFSLLHAPRAEMPGHLAAIARALRPSGLFHLGLKLGTGEERDALGRFYTYYTDAELQQLLTDAGLTVSHTDFGTGEGLSGRTDPFIIVTSRRVPDA
ncbi:class I SAM-dependent methyltransferase [Dinoroseobacter sp. PD6]|uniref:class I SAM-dependent DNA methyltransferase n=1 Tax=Dinoroseobacter sp. PD6 TaxID=3028384 RepID=UPI00237BD7BF|nr:class I SAM-dependent methyltransferase [Dinoroseobacter sp. PD6]MDD9717315.1 class I SAM-dependent methyltransferase [Dinoroseobacter sp. PD6]